MFSFGRDRTASANQAPPAAGPLDGTEGVVVSQNGAQRLATAQAIANLGGGLGGGDPAGSAAAAQAAAEAYTDAALAGLITSAAWTPVLSFGGGVTGITYASRSGRYVQIGNMVVANFSFVLTSKGTDAGVAIIGGLPSHPAAASRGGGVLFNFGATNLPATAAVINTFADSFGPVLYCKYMDSGFGPTFMRDTEFTDTTLMDGQIIYFV